MLARTRRLQTIFKLYHYSPSPSQHLRCGGPPNRSYYDILIRSSHPRGLTPMSLSHQPTRREFLKTTGAAFGVPFIITSTALGNSERPPASDRIVMGGIGIGNMGRGDQGSFLRRKDVQYVAMSDVREEVRDKSKGAIDGHYGNSDCQVYNDFRELLARPDIDAVHIATPDHWHAIMVIEACRIGKDVYCQKPETFTLREGPLMIAAARR